MEEFDREGLPLIVMANWRGFSGGQRDLFEGVLQVNLPESGCQQSLSLQFCCIKPVFLVFGISLQRRLMHTCPSACMTVQMHTVCPPCWIKEQQGDGLSHDTAFRQRLTSTAQAIC